MTARLLDGRSGTYDPNPPREEFTFGRLVRGREDEYPLLARASRNVVPATNVVIEWTLPDGAVGTNWQQIVRYPYDAQPVEEGSFRDVRDTDVDESGQRFLAAVEKILWDGKPGRSEGRSSCGGVRHYLGRDPRPEDGIILRPLREPFLWIRTHDADPGVDYEEFRWVKRERPIVEWLAEFSLQVIPA